MESDKKFKYDDLMEIGIHNKIFGMLREGIMAEVRMVREILESFGLEAGIASKFFVILIFFVGIYKIWGRLESLLFPMI